MQEFNFHFLIHTSHLLEERLRIRLTPLGIHPRQARVLDALSRMKDASQVTLAKEFDLSEASMSTMTARLLEAGLIERHVNQRELRSNVLQLSKHGETLLKEIYREWKQIDQEISDVIGTTNAMQLTNLTQQLRNALGGFSPGSPAEERDTPNTGIK